MNDRGFNSEPGIRSLGVFSQLWLRVTNRFHGYVYPKRGDELSSLLINIPTFTKFRTNFDVFTSSNLNAFSKKYLLYRRETSMTIKNIFSFFLPTKNLYISYTSLHAFFSRLSRFLRIFWTDPLFQV